MGVKSSTDGAVRAVNSLHVREASFPKTIRLRTRLDFKRLAYAKGRYVGKWVIVDYCKSNLPYARLGITASRRYGDSHERNRFKRIVREAFRLSYCKFPTGYDLNVKPRSEAKKAKMGDIMKELLCAITTPKLCQDGQDSLNPTS